MNTPKEKAKELVEKYWIYLRAGLLYDEEAKEDAKHCALIAVDEILDELSEMNYGLQYLNRVAHWQEVKEEIEKL
jgi:hypothetical protein